MITNDKIRYFILVRLFKGWEDQLDLFGSCAMVYNSMRVEVNQMSFTETGDELYQKWYLLHKSIDFDSPFDVLIKKDLSRSEMIELKSKLHTPIYQDEVSEEVLDKELEQITDSDSYFKVFFGAAEPSNAIQPTYNSWMAEFKDTLSKFEKITVPDID